MGACKIKDNEEEMMLDIKSLDRKELEDWIQKKGFEPYRARQIWHWILKKTVASFDQMTDLPKSLRKIMNEEVDLSPLELVKLLESKEDETRKYLFRLRDGNFIESVLIPELEKGYFTICISSQAGCMMGCKFCFTARQGFKRNLKTSEIIDQVVQVKRSMSEPSKLRNIVFMGMGEPLLNYDNLIKAIRIFIDPYGMNFSHRRVTVSTCGLVPYIRRLGEEDVRVNLAVSLNAADDEKRSLLMPINRRYPLKELMAACKRFPLPNGRRITFEYVLIDGINDSIEDAKRLVELIRGIRAKINLIPLNPSPGIEFSPPPWNKILAFQKVLIESNLTAIIRKSRGRDIMAACGQLSGRYGKDKAKIKEIG